MFEFLENYRSLSVRVPDMDAPMPGVDGVVLTCRLADGIAVDELPVTAPRQLRELWCRTAGGLLLVDMQFGICGLTLFDPVESFERSKDRSKSGYEIYDSDWVIGEFTGDTDMVVVDERDKAIISVGSYCRDQWLIFDSLEALLQRYIDSNAEKFWDSGGGWDGDGGGGGGAGSAGGAVARGPQSFGAVTRRSS